MAGYHVLAKMHKEDMPNDPRTIEELEQYYLGLEMGSPFAPLVHAMKEADAAESAKFEANIAINNARRK